MLSNKSHLTDEQKIAVDVLDRAMILSAGAGSGKTTVLVERYTALIKSGIDPKAILCVTFTSEAAGELRERIVRRLTQLEFSEELIESVENTPWIGTIHSFCYTLLEMYGSLIGLSSIEEISGYFDLSHLFQVSYQTWFESLEDSTLSGLLQFFSARELKEMAERLFFDHFQFARAVGRIEKSEELEHRIVKRLYSLLSPLFKKIEASIHDRGSYTFNDLETLTLKLLEKSELARTKVKDQFQSMLIDEFQDTSRLQWTILSYILDDSWKKLFVVGDPKQSIYGFRYADVSLFKEVSRKIEELGGVTQELTLNFRTQGTLLDGINRLSRSLFDGTTVPFSSMKEGRIDTGPDVEVIEYTLEEDADRKDAQEVELKTVVGLVQKYLQAGTAPGEIAMLFRNGDRLKEYQEVLRQLNIHSVAKASYSLFESDEMIDIANYLRAVEDPLNDFYLGAFLRSSFVKMDLLTLSKYRAKRDIPLLTQIIEEPPANLKWFLGLLESGETRVSAVLETLFKETKSFPEFHEGVLALLAPLTKIDSLPEAVARLKSWESKGISVEVGGEDTTDAVRLMTVHSAKGLEFNHVILADALRQMPYGVPTLLLHPDLPPGLRYKKEGEAVQTKDYQTILEKQRRGDVEEANRIMYVALTRARETLTLVLPKNLKTLPKGSWALILREAMQEVLPMEEKN